MINNFINTVDFSQKEINEIIKLAIAFKSGKTSRKLKGKILGLMFFNPSLRTRVSSIVAMEKLGGSTVDFLVSEGGVYPFEFAEKKVMDSDKVEHIKDAAAVISRYCDAIAIRASDLVTRSSKSVAVSSWEDLKEDKVI